MTAPPADKAPPFSRPKAIAALPAKGTTVVLKADPAECERLAADLDIVAVDSLEATLTLTPFRKTGVRVAGAVRGRVKQACVVTLEPVDETVVEEIDRTFVPDSELGPVAEEIEIDPEAPDPPDPLEGGTLDLGVIAAEHLALGLDPYPRAPGVTFQDRIEDDGEAEEEEPSPFAALSRLKGDGPPDR